MLDAPRESCVELLKFKYCAARVEAVEDAVAG